MRKINGLVDSWLHAQGFSVESDEYDDVCWAIDELYDLAREKPKELIETVLKILSVDSSKKIAGALGAGVLEELLVYHGDSFIALIRNYNR